MRDQRGKSHPLDIAPGGHVLFGRWSSDEIKPDGEDW
jgi:co-chaperonin GroES (HSP10)